MASTPPPTRPSSTPWFVAMALVATTTFGFSLTMAGCRVVELYGQPRTDPAAVEWVQSVPQETDREAVAERLSHLDDTLDAAKNRLFPLSVAQLVLGVAMVVLATRAMAGRVGARNMLLQVVVAQAGLAVVTHFTTPDVQRAYVDASLALSAAASRAAAPDGEPVPALVVRLVRLSPVFALFFETFFAAIVVLALTRPRARAFFEGTDPVSER